MNLGYTDNNESIIVEISEDEAIDFDLRMMEFEKKMETCSDADNKAKPNISFCDIFRFFLESIIDSKIPEGFLEKKRGDYTEADVEYGEWLIDELVGPLDILGEFIDHIRETYPADRKRGEGSEKA